MRLYRWLVRLSSPALRRDYGAAMEETFAERLRDARRFGRRHVTRVWTREIAGLVVLAITDRWERAPKGRRPFTPAETRASLMDRISQDIHHAGRRLLRSPAFTLASVLTLALAIGANVAIFAVVQRVILNPLPYPESDRLVQIDHGAQRLNATGMGLTSGLYLHYGTRARTIDGMAIYRSEDLTLTGHAEPMRIRVARATPSLSSVLGVSPIVGRWFNPSEGAPGGARVAVLSYGFWARQFGRDPGVLGRAITLGGESTEIIGVMPPSYAFPDPTIDISIPEQLSTTMGFGLWNYSGVARLAPSATVDGALAELNGLIRDVAAAYPQDPRARGNADSRLFAIVVDLKEATVGHVARAMWLMLASVGVVLLVAGANVANLFLVRSEARQREVAVRRALGANRAALARYFFSESVLLSLIGGATGVGLAWAAVRALLQMGPLNLPRLHEVQIDMASLAYAGALTLVSILVFGLIPFSRGRQFASALHDSGRSNTASRRRHRTRRVLMAAQTALALVLLIASGLMVRSFQKIRGLDPGFNPTSALTFSIGLPNRGYRTVDAAVAAHHTLIDRIAALPGVTKVSTTTCLPIQGACYGNTVRVEGRTISADSPPSIGLFRAVAGGYFEAVGIPLLRGRVIGRDDVDRKEAIAVVSETLAKRLFPNEDAIGKRIASNRAPPAPGKPPDMRWLEIVGIVADTSSGRTLPAGLNPMPQLYMPMSISGGPGVPRTTLIGPEVDIMSYVVRTSTPPRDLLPAIRAAIDAFDKNLPLAQVQTLQEILDRATARMAFTMTLLAIAATIALVLGMIGIYGVMSYIVNQRTAEIGVRLALGAEPGNVAGQIVGQGGLVTLAGVVVGLAAAFAGSRLMESLLYGISARDPMVFVAATLALLLVALLACWIPARRAARLDPVTALRAE
jgi:putative ABC transport system permease protein